MPRIEKLYPHIVGLAIASFVHGCLLLCCVILSYMVISKQVDQPMGYTQKDWAGEMLLILAEPVNTLTHSGINVPFWMCNVVWACLLYTLYLLVAKYFKRKHQS